MADVAAARREARRRRILENSQSRLQFISGKSSTEQLTGTPNGSTLEPVLDPDISVELIEDDKSCGINVSSSSNGIIAPELTSFLGTNHSELTASDIVHGLSVSPNEAQLLSTWEKFALYKFDVVILAVLLQVLCSLTASSGDSFYFFLPVALYTVTKNFWLPSKKPSNIANFLLLLNGMSPTKVQVFTQIFQLLSAFSQDVCVFLFMIICMQSLISVFTDKFLP